MKISFKLIVISVVGSLIISLLLLFSNVRNNYEYDYTSTMEVDKSEKVEQAISICVNDVKSRNFIVVKLKVYNGWFNKKIICSGITKDRLMKD